ncbi:MIP/aquaporin family protein [Borrelia hermsii]|uniref:Glycerol facilitator n=3 Tax=Borrelia hermsii TaxID=140 RepID=Q84I24_BORHD|nr:MIP/aquaporin family protein [Borrelia hermsii]AAO37928.1 glycerol facilitator [Borrelia hermsii DAH]AAX16755.1 glycerol uptake facilitator protein [Borrelia hermsii DAH]AJW73056.1 porin [Borrelia hermsii CC1]AMR75589.1 Glycerol uptake facilitator protein [Borrelia hermsii]ANA43054.1 aquaporin [Borrelia hermsii HS1]
MIYIRFKEFIAEFLGTFILLALGTGSIAMTTLFPSNPAVAGEIIKGGYTNIVLGWGLGVTFGVYTAAKISGAHLNPALSIGLASIGKFPTSKLFHYILAQILGAFSGALMTLIVFYPKWIEIDPTFEITQGIMSTFPAVSGFWPGFIDQIFGTFLLMFLVLVVGKFVKEETQNPFFPFIIGAIVLAIGISFGGMNGYAINPARDLGPRILLLLAGFKNHGFDDMTVFIIPILGPIIGAILGAIVYEFTLEDKNNLKEF